MRCTQCGVEINANSKRLCGKCQRIAGHMAEQKIRHGTLCAKLKQKTSRKEAAALESCETSEQARRIVDRRIKRVTQEILSHLSDQEKHSRTASAYVPVTFELPVVSVAIDEGIHQ